MLYSRYGAVRVVLAALVPAIICVTGCTSPFPERTPISSEISANGNTLRTYDQILDEYSEETKILDLVPGDVWPETPDSLAIRPPADHMFEEGIGKQDAQFIWYCSWAKQGVKSNDSSALEKLKLFKQMSVWPHIDDIGHALFNRIESGIGAGDLEPLTDYISNNCEGE